MNFAPPENKFKILIFFYLHLHVLGNKGYQHFPALLFIKSNQTFFLPYNFSLLLKIPTLFSKIAL